MRTTPKFFNRFPDFGHVFQRFPVAVLAMAMLTLVWIVLPDYRLRDTIGLVLTGLVVGGYLCVIITIAREIEGRSNFYIVQILITLLIAVLFYFSETLRLNVPMAVGAVLLALGNAVGWRRERDDLRVWDFTHKLWTGAIMAIVCSVIFLLGMLSIMVALKTLLGIDVETLVTDLLMPIGFGFLAPLYWLSTLPPVDESYEELYDNPGFVSKAIGFLGTWILAPLSLTYAVIILAYGVKILFLMDLPKGEIAVLTIPFLIIGTLTWLILEPPFIQKHALARWFRWLWFPVSIPVTLLLAVAVFIRVMAYGITEERYALILVAIWSLGLGMWFSFRKEIHRDIRIVPGFGAALLLIGTFSALPVSLKSQTNRAQDIVAELGLLDDNNDVSPIANPSKEQTVQLRQLKTQITYLSRHEAKRSLRSIFPNVSMTDTSQEIFEDLKIENLPNYRNRNNKNIFFKDEEKSIDVEGFDTLKGLYATYGFRSDTVKTLTSDDEDVSITQQANQLNVTHADGHSVSVGLRHVVETMKPFETKPYIFDMDERTRLHFKIITLRPNEKTGEEDIQNMSFYVLLRD